MDRRMDGWMYSILNVASSHFQCRYHDQFSLEQYQFDVSRFEAIVLKGCLDICCV